MEDNTTMVRTLSKWNLLAIGVGAVIGWSWVIYAGYWSTVPGTLGGVLAFAVAALLCSLVGLVYAELTSAFPKIGIEESVTFIALGRIPALIVSWCILYLWMSFILVEAIMFPIILGNLGFDVPVFGQMFTVMGSPVMFSNVIIAVIINLFFAVINYRGVKLSGWVQTLAVGFLTLAAIFFCGSGITMGHASNAQPLFTSTAGLTTVMLMVPGFLSGFHAVPQGIEETNISPKTVGKLVVYTVIGSALFYILIIVGLAFAMPEADRAGEGLVVIQAVGQLFKGSRIAMGFVTFASLLGMLSTWNAAYIAGSRFLYGLSRAKLLPQTFAVLHPKYRTPKNAIILMGIVGTLAPLAGTNSTIYVGLMDIASFGLIITWLLVSVAFIKLRKTNPDLERPYKVPAGNIIGWAAIIFSAAYLFLYTPWGPSGLLPIEWAGVLVILVIAVIIYFAYNRREGNISYDAQKELLLGEEIADSLNATEVGAEHAAAAPDAEPAAESMAAAPDAAESAGDSDQQE